MQERVDAVNLFYQTEDRAGTEAFLDEFNVTYIVVGQLEQAFYPGEGLTKFELYDGVLWQEVFRTGSTVIYQVLGLNSDSLQLLTNRF